MVKDKNNTFNECVGKFNIKISPWPSANEPRMLTYDLQCTAKGSAQGLMIAYGQN